jgi:hypothetical protein
MVVRNWDKGKEIRTMENGEEKDDLLCFRWQHKVGNKYINQYCVDEIFPLGGERMKVTNNPDFSVYVQEHYIIDKEDDESQKEDVDSGYFSDEELPLDEMDKVSDEWFDDHLINDTAVVTPNKSSSPFDENDLFTSIDLILLLGMMTPTMKQIPSICPMISMEIASVHPRIRCKISSVHPRIL